VFYHCATTVGSGDVFVATSEIFHLIKIKNIFLGLSLHLAVKIGIRGLIHNIEISSKLMNGPKKL
jgi:hypothetical protein